MSDLPERVYRYEGWGDNGGAAYEQERIGDNPCQEYIRADLVPQWRDMPAPTLSRIMVAGIQPRRGNVQSYWWIHEDMSDENGVPIDKPQALKWMSLPNTPTEEPK